MPYMLFILTHKQLLKLISLPLFFGISKLFLAFIVIIMFLRMWKKWKASLRARAKETNESKLAKSTGTERTMEIQEGASSYLTKWCEFNWGFEEGNVSSDEEGGARLEGINLWQSIILVPSMDKNMQTWYTCTLHTPYTMLYLLLYTQWHTLCIYIFNSAMYKCVLMINSNLHSFIEKMHLHIIINRFLWWI